jgi:hypothetical protein
MISSKDKNPEMYSLKDESRVISFQIMPYHEDNQSLFMFIQKGINCKRMKEIILISNNSDDSNKKIYQALRYIKLNFCNGFFVKILCVPKDHRCHFGEYDIIIYVYDSALYCPGDIKNQENTQHIFRHKFYSYMDDVQYKDWVDAKFNATKEKAKHIEDLYRYMVVADRTYLAETLNIIYKVTNEITELRRERFRYMVKKDPELAFQIHPYYIDANVFKSDIITSDARGFD